MPIRFLPQFLPSAAFLSLALIVGAALPSCATPKGRLVSSSAAAEQNWRASAERELGFTARTLSASVAFDQGAARKVAFFSKQSLSSSVELNGGVLTNSIHASSGEHTAFLEMLAASALSEADQQIEAIYIETDGLTDDQFNGLNVKGYLRGTKQLQGQAYGVLARKEFTLPAGLKELFRELTAPVPKLPIKKERINFGGELDPAEAFRRVGFDPEKIAIVVTDEKGEEQSYDVSFFHDRYYLGGVSFAQHPKRWEDYSGIPSTHLHGRGLGTLLYILATFQLKDFSKMPLVSDGNRSGQADSVWENLVAAGWAAKSNPPGSGGVATYKFNMKALEKQPLMKKFSERREVIQVRGEEG